MKTPILLGIITGLTAFTAVAQDTNTQGGDDQNTNNNRRKGPPPSRLVITLDADHDKVISADEIAASTAALETLDKNGDGELTKEEFARPKPGKAAQARDDDSNGDDKPSSQRPPPPDRLAGAIDADHDHVITAEEMTAAPESLATLDKNADGQLTRDEFAPKPRRKPHSSDGSTDDQSSQRDGQGECPQGGQDGGEDDDSGANNQQQGGQRQR